jgi:hypothetical protein
VEIFEKLSYDGRRVPANIPRDLQTFVPLSPKRLIETASNKAVL